jgi:hypothetical protein
MSRQVGEIAVSHAQSSQVKRGAGMAQVLLMPARLPHPETYVLEPFFRHPARERRLPDHLILTARQRLTRHQHQRS